MSNLSDKEIDRLSREAADSYEPDYSSLSWSRLEQKLIEQMPERPPDGFSFGRINPYLWGPAVLLVAGVSFFMIKNNIYSKPSTRTNEPASQISVVPSGDSIRTDAHALQVVSPSSAQTLSSPDSKKESPTNQSTTPSPQTDQQIVGDAASAAKLTPGQLSEQRSGNPAALANANDQKMNPKARGSAFMLPSAAAMAGADADKRTMESHPSTPSAKGETAGSFVHTVSEQLSGSKASGAVMADVSTAKTIETPTESPVYGLPALAYSSMGLGNIQGNDSLLNKLAQSTPRPGPQKSMHINRSLNIGLAFGTDYTDAGGIANNELSNNIGITLGYYLTRKISMNTGIIYSNKFYWSPGHGTNRQSNPWLPPTVPPNNYNPTWAYAPDIEYVNGSCNMYELPLTLRYDFANNDKTKFFVNAGLSSYFMLKQTYIYFFHSRGRPLAWKNNIESQSNYWFGMGDLSFGLETDLGKGFSFQAEPFFRIPLQKMGAENLKLYSYGFMLSFRYAPVLSRSKK
jgi:hypothetical protein